MEKKNTGLIVLVIVLSLLVIVLSGYIIYDKVLNNNVNENNYGLEINKDELYIVNKTFVIDEKDLDNDKVYNEEIKSRDKNDNNKIVNRSVTFSSKFLKVDNKSIVELEDGAYYLWQISFYEDIIITSQSYSLGYEIDIYDYDGNVIKKIKLFKDNNNRMFYAYLRYSDNEIFNVSDDGDIYFVGTKHGQGAAGTYLTDSGNDINILFDEYDIEDDSVVEGVFEVSYLGNNSFSDIKCVKTLQTFREFREFYSAGPEN